MSLKDRSSSGDQHPHPSRVLLMQQLRVWSTLVFTYFLCSLKRCSSWQPRARSLSVTLTRSCLHLPINDSCLLLSSSHLPIVYLFFIGKSPFNALVPRHRSACWLFVFSLFLYLLFALLLLYFVFLCARLFNRIFYRLFRCVSFSLPIAASSRGVLSAARLLLSCSSLASVACFGGFLFLWRCFGLFVFCFDIFSNFIIFSGFMIYEILIGLYTHTRFLCVILVEFATNCWQQRELCEGEKGAVMDVDIMNV